jgi:hypothetical protein
MKFHSTCSKAIAALFATSFVISALIALLLFNAQNRLFNSETYKKALEEQEIYSVLPTLLSKQIARSITYNPCLENPDECLGENQAQDPEDDSNGPPTYFKNLSQEDWEQILSQILTPAWTKSQAESVLDQFFAFLDSGEDKLRITISLAGLKTNLTGEKGMDIIRILVNAQPPCTKSILGIFVDMVAGDFSPEQLLSCRPPQDLIDDLAPVMESALDLVIDQLPETVSLEKRVFEREESRISGGHREGLQIDFNDIRFLMQISPVLPFVSLVLLTIFGVRSLKDFLLWWGIPFVILGLSALVLGWVGLPILNWSLTTFVQDRIPAVIDPTLVDIGFESLRWVYKSLFRAIAFQAGPIALLGMILSGTGVFITFRQRTP